MRQVRLRLLHHRRGRLELELRRFGCFLLRYLIYTCGMRAGAYPQEDFRSLATPPLIVIVVVSLAWTGLYTFSPATVGLAPHDELMDAEVEGDDTGGVRYDSVEGIERCATSSRATASPLATRTSPAGCGLCSGGRCRRPAALRPPSTARLHPRAGSRAGTFARTTHG